ncbi:MAG: hypothetical protein OXF21_00680, partial [bacterium]|nr:hypothetical protein [bacterium]
HPPLPNLPPPNPQTPTTPQRALTLNPIPQQCRLLGVGVTIFSAPNQLLHRVCRSGSYEIPNRGRCRRGTNIKIPAPPIIPQKCHLV